MNTNDIRIESTLPKAWEEGETFSDTLYEWMNRTPWVAISAALHVVVFMIIAAIPWNVFEKEKKIIIICPIAELPPEIPVEIIEPEPIVEPEAIIDEPVIQDVPVDQYSPVDMEDNSDRGDPNELTEVDMSHFNENILGIGPGGGGNFGRDRFGTGRTRGSGSGTDPYLQAALVWLDTHQSPDGSWDADGFGAHCGSIGAGQCDGEGVSTHDVGVTGLALLSFLGDGSTTLGGQYKMTVTRGIQWLREQQDPDTGLFGEAIGHSYLYDHAIATLAFNEAYYFSKSPMLKGNAQKATNFIMRARNPYGAWRYDVPPVGDNDTSVTGWMVFALKAAKEAGLKVADESFVGALTWFDEVTDPANGRVGYDSMGSLSSRVTGINDAFPPEKGESMTAVGLLCRFFLGQRPGEDPVMTKHADLMLKSLPEWDEEGLGNDMYYWYYGSYAMYQMGGKHWTRWNKAMKKAVFESQRQDGDFKGSWDPSGPWGWSGGRVYSTALMALSLEVYFRYSPLLGAR